MHFIIYETTNNINGKKYRGRHATKNVDDGYLGSGVLLLKAVEKYGEESFTRQILQDCHSVDELIEAEALWVSDDWIKDEMTYNLKVGGAFGGWDYLNINGKNPNRWTKKHHEDHIVIMEKRKKNGTWGQDPASLGFLGKKHSEKSKRKISENNAMTLSAGVVQKRKTDVENVGNQRGYITKLGKLWGVSHTQVRKFIDKYT